MPSPFRKKLKTVARIHAWLLFFSFVSYALLGFALGPYFFATDLSKKINALADESVTVTALVLAPSQTGEEESEEEEEDEEDEQKNKKDKLKEEIAVSSASSLDPSFNFSVTVDNPSASLPQKSELFLRITALDKVFPQGAVFDVLLLDSEGNEVLRLPSYTLEQAEKEFSLSAMIPLSVVPGIYQVRVDAKLNKKAISRFASLEVRSWPLLTLGSGKEISYSQVASFVGAFFYVLLSLFLLMLLLFLREYWLQLHALRKITEYHLERFGFISPSKKI